MLVAISLTFVLVRLPYVVFYFLNQQNTKKALWGDRSDYIWVKFQIHTAYTISMCLSTVNYVTNFFFYWCIGSSFRREFRRLISVICRRLSGRTVAQTRCRNTGGSTCSSNYYSSYSIASRRSMVSTVTSRRNTINSDLINHTVGQGRTSNSCYAPVRATNNIVSFKSAKKPTCDVLYGTVNDACCHENTMLNSTV